MLRRLVSLFMVPVLLLFSVCNVTTVHAEETNKKNIVPFKGYEFQSYEPGEDDAELRVENGALVYAVEKLSLEDWQNKVFIDSGVTFEKGKRYTVDFTISASRDTYFSFFINQIGAWNPAVSEFLNIGDYVENYSFTTSTIDADMAMEVLFQFGGSGNRAPLKVTISDFAIYEAAAEETTSVYRVAGFNGLSTSAEGAAGSNLYIEGSSLVFETAASGKVKIEDLSFKKGCDYEIVYTVRADRNVMLACSVDPAGGYFAPGGFATLSGSPQTISRRTGVQHADRQMEITFDINKASNGERAKVIFDQILIKEIKDGQEQISRNAWVVDGFQLNHEESGGAAADLGMDEAGDVIYRIEKIGENDWNNKVMANKGIVFEKGNSYKVDIALEADKDMRVFFGVNPKGKWEPKISETLVLNEGLNEFSFTTKAQEYDEDMEVLFQFGGFGNTAPCNIKMKGMSIKVASTEDIAEVAAQRAEITDPILVKEYNFSKLDNYKFKGFVTNDPSGSELYLEQGVLVYDIKDFNINQLVKKDVWLSKNSKYNIEMQVSASRPMNLECYVSGRNTQEDLTKCTRTIGDRVEVIKTEFRTGSDTEDQGRLVFDLSNNQGSGKFYVHSVVIKAIEEGVERTYPMELIDLDDPDVVHTDSKSSATATLVKGGLRYNVKRFSGNSWENKITLNNIAEFKKDKTYIVDFDMRTSKSIVFTCMMHNLESSDGQDDWEYFWERNRTVGDETQHFRFTFKAKEDNALNEMIFELGGQGNTKKGPASIFISDIKVTQCADYRNETIRFPGSEGVFSYEHGASSASGKLYQENGVLVYEIDSQGIADWHNQLIFNQGIKFDEGYRYRIDVTASANKSTNVKFTLTSQVDSEEKIKRYGILSTKETTLSYETDMVQQEGENVEFSLRFGGMYNKGNTIIKISDVKIYKLGPGTAYNDVAIEDEDLEIEYENSDYYESVDFKGYKFNSTLIGDADASLYEEGGILHYQINEVGTETYHNKVSLNNVLTARADKNYIIEITARADSPMKFFFAMNGIEGEWDPLVAENIDLTGDYATYTFRTNSQEVDKNVDIIFEFGGNGNTAPNHAYIQDFKIREVNDIVDEVTVGLEEGDFTHEEANGAKGILYTNDDGNMVYYAKILGNNPSDNKVTMAKVLKAFKDNRIEVTLKPQKGLDVRVSAIDADSGEELASETAWIGGNETKTIRLPIAALENDQDIAVQNLGRSVVTQDEGRDIIVLIMFGQTSFAEDRGDNRIEFVDFKIIVSEPIVDAGTVTFGGYQFTHGEDGDVAKGILYLDDDGNMVYYAKKLGNLDYYNKVFAVIEGVEAGAQYALTVEVEPEKGLDMITTIPNAKNASGSGDAWFKNWIGSDAPNKFTYKVTAQSDTLEVNFQVGQESYAADRENNHIVFKSFTVEKYEGGSDAVTFGDYEFTHEESGSVAQGSLYLDDNGNMVYYAEKLGNTDWHNKVFTTIKGVEVGAEYTLTVELELEKGLDMVTTIPNAKKAEDGTDAWYKEWIAENTPASLTHKITAQEDTLDIFFQVGQESYADAREDNHIVFKSFSLVKNGGDIDTDKITFGMFEHAEEPGSGAVGSLYLDDNDNMVYYAQTLSTVDWHNKVFTTIEGVTVGKQYTLKVEVEPEEGLNMVTTISGAKNAEADGDAWYKDWIEKNTSTTLTHKITAQSEKLEIFFQFGQDEYAAERQDNHITFKSISLNGNECVFEVKESEGDVDTDDITFGMFEHAEEPGSGAVGSLYLDDNDNMVYYAQTLSTVDWHNKVFTTIEGVTVGKQYTLKVEVEPEEGLNMVTTISGAKNAEADGDAWYKDWIEKNTSTTLTHKITAQSEKLEIFFQFGQDEYATERQNNKITFTLISLNDTECIFAELVEGDDTSGASLFSLKDEPLSKVEITDEIEKPDTETGQEQEEEEDKQGEKGDAEPDADKDADVTTPVEQSPATPDPATSENDGEEAKEQPEGTGTNVTVPDADEEGDTDESGSEESEKQPEDTEADNSAQGSDEEGNTAGEDSEGSENNDTETDEQPEGTGTDSAVQNPDEEEKEEDTEEDDLEESESDSVKAETDGSGMNNAIIPDSRKEEDEVPAI